MPKIWHNKVAYWSRKETAQYNTERHQVFKEELYPLASLPRSEFRTQLEIFKEKNFDLLNNKEGLKNV